MCLCYQYMDMAGCVYVMNIWIWLDMSVLQINGYDWICPCCEYMDMDGYGWI